MSPSACKSTVVFLGTYLRSMSSSEYTISAPYSAASSLVGIVFTRTIGARMFFPL